MSDENGFCEVERLSQEMIEILAKHSFEAQTFALAQMMAALFSVGAMPRAKTENLLRNWLAFVFEFLEMLEEEEREGVQ